MTVPAGYRGALPPIPDECYPEGAVHLGVQLDDLQLERVRLRSMLIEVMVALRDGRDDYAQSLLHRAIGRLGGAGVW